MAKGQFSLVVALYNVAEYVPAFLESLRTQSYPVQDLDIVVVDDGSTDDSARIVEQWARRHHPGLRLIRQENAGPGAARNAGLAAVGNTWVTFCDPDDVFHPRYFSEVAAFLSGDTNNSAQLLATRLVQFQDGTVVTNHGHALGKKFRLGNVLANLEENPEFIQLHGPTAFLRRAVLEQHELQFDERIRPKFEDAHLIGRYLAAAGKPVVGVVATAHYLYRRNRRNGSSLVAGAWTDPRAYEELPRYGYLGMLQSVRDKLGRIPDWAQYMVLYDLVWLYVDDKRIHSPTAGATPEQQNTMHGLLERIIELIDQDVIDTFGVVSQGWIFHNILSSYYKKNQGTPVVQEWQRDDQRQTIRYSYLFQGSRPEEKIFVDGAAVTPVASKVREHRLLGRTLIRERILILPAGERVEMLFDGNTATVTTDRGVPLQLGRAPVPEAGMDLRPPAVPSTGGSPVHRRINKLHRKVDSLSANRRVHRAVTGATALAEVGHSTARVVERIEGRRAAAKQSQADHRLMEQAASEPAVSKYRDAWLLMDQVKRADDNAEHLYRYLMHNRPDINAWFVLSRESRDWERLTAEGFRLIAHGSDELVLLALNAAFKISSHANAAMEFPVSPKRFGEDSAKFVFLQHGVTKDDMSRWLNLKTISLMITASSAEHHSIVGDGNTYNLTSHDVKLTGFPRHDALLAASEQVPAPTRQTILVAPTWREYLRDELASAASETERAALLEGSEFGRNWLQLLRSPGLEELCQERGLGVVFLPHPEMESIVPLLDLPEHVRAVAYSDIRVQEQLVETRILVTDYSSVAFDAAYAGARVVYMQFDGKEFFAGGHVYRRGYFDYGTDGLGPVVTDAESVVRVLSDVTRENSPDLFRDRIRDTFKYWDGRACARVTAAIEDLSGPGGRQMDSTESPHAFGFEK